MNAHALDLSSNPDNRSAARYRKRSQHLLIRRLRTAKLKLVDTEALGIERRRSGRGFIYLDEHGKRVRDAGILARIRALAIPPAYEEVHVATDEHAHVQAIGRDESGRLQHLYHPDWLEIREERKADQLSHIIDVLPRIREAVNRDIASRKLDYDKAVACAVALIDDSHIRVGCEAYAQHNGSRGAATLLKRHVEIRGSSIALRFPGKGSKTVACSIVNPRLANALKRMAALPGDRLFQFIGASGKPQSIRAKDVNAYLSRISGIAVTAKDLRMLGATASATEELAHIRPSRSRTKRKRQLAEVMRAVARHLANTPAVARKSYVSHLVVRSFKTGYLAKAYRNARGGSHRRRVENAIGRLLARGAEQ